MCRLQCMLVHGKGGSSHLKDEDTVQPQLASGGLRSTSSSPVCAAGRHMNVNEEGPKKAHPNSF